MFGGSGGSQLVAAPFGRPSGDKLVIVPYNNAYSEVGLAMFGWDPGAEACEFRENLLSRTNINTISTILL